MRWPHTNKREGPVNFYIFFIPVCKKIKTQNTFFSKRRELQSVTMGEPQKARKEEGYT
jgi:hypothetical protein